MTSEAPVTFAERDRLQRWIAGIGLAQAAEDIARLDTPEANALALIGAHSACESLLGLLYGKRRYKRSEDVPLPTLIADVDKQIGLDPDLADDPDAMHRMRNGFVHASNTVHANEAARAIAAARRLLDIVAERSVPGVPLASGHGVASAVAAIVEVEALGMWLRHADEMLAAGRLELAADGCARVSVLNPALDGRVCGGSERLGAPGRARDLAGHLRAPPLDRRPALATTTVTGTGLPGLAALPNLVTGLLQRTLHYRFA